MVQDISEFFFFISEYATGLPMVVRKWQAKLVDFIVMKTENRQAGHAGGDAVDFDKAQSFWKALLYAIITNTSYWMEECFRGSYEVGEMPGMTR